jgi:hypothetical protein
MAGDDEPEQQSEALGWGKGVVTSCVLKECRHEVADAMEVSQSRDALKCTSQCSPWTEDCVLACGAGVSYLGSNTTGYEGLQFNGPRDAFTRYNAFYTCVDQKGCVEAGNGWGFGVSSVCADARCGASQKECSELNGCRRGLTCLQYSCPLWTTKCVEKCALKAESADGMEVVDGGDAPMRRKEEADGTDHAPTAATVEAQKAGHAFRGVAGCLRDRGCIDLSRESMASTLANVMKWGEGVDSVCVHRRCEHKIEKALLNPLSTKALECTVECERWNVECIKSCTDVLLADGDSGQIQGQFSADLSGAGPGGAGASVMASSEGWYSLGNDDRDAQNLELADDDDDDDLMINAESLAALQQLAADDDASAQDWADAFSKARGDSAAADLLAKNQKQDGDGGGSVPLRRLKQSAKNQKLVRRLLAQRRKQVGKPGGREGRSVGLGGGGQRRGLMSANATRAALRAFEEMTVCVHEHGCIDETVYDGDESTSTAGFQLGISQVCAFSRCGEQEESCRDNPACKGALECSTDMCQPYTADCALR